MKQLDNRRRVVIESLRLQIDSGKFPIKKTIGEKVNVHLNIFCDGHDDIRAELLFKHIDARQCSVAEMTPLVNDEWFANFEASQIGELAPASLIQEPEAAPEPFSLLYKQSVYQSMRALTLKVFGELGRNKARLSDSVTDEAGQLFGKKQTILKHQARINAKKIEGMKIKIHGDCSGDRKCLENEILSF